jgi:predicted ABC-type transport system involved in lysophospholipase L1 biosynthesis ATPase subunit
MIEPLVSVKNLVKTYQALRPLRVQSLVLNRGDLIAVGGLDAEAAEMFIGLLTGAVLPDSGEIRLFGKSTADVIDSDAWLAMLDGVGIMTDRAVLIGQFSVEQNIAMPFTLEIDPVAAAMRPQLQQLAEEVGLGVDDLTTRIAESRPEVQVRVRLARAIALNPLVLLAEHPSATLTRDTVKAFATDLSRVARARNLAVLAITADDAFASALGGQLLRLEAATGVLKPRSSWRNIFG